MRNRNKRFIQVETIPKNKKKNCEKQLEDKIRRLYALAEEIGVKIGADDD